MYKSLIPGVLFTLSALFPRAQNLVQNEFHADSDPHFKVTTVPDSTSGEGAVILAHKAEYAYFTRIAGGKRYAHMRSTYRSRVKVQNQNALETYGEFTYDPALGIGIRIFKPDGKVILPDTSESVPLETAGMEPGAQAHMCKLAISRLEVGDIIDYYQVFDDSMKTDRDILSTPAEYYTFDYPYPILHQELIFRLGNFFHFHHHSYNGAPDIQEITGETPNERVFHVAQGPVPNYDRPDWNMYLLREPYLKFQAYFVPSGGALKSSPGFLRKDEPIRTALQESDFIELFHRYRKKAARNKDYRKGPYSGLVAFFRSNPYWNTRGMQEAWEFYRYAWVDNPSISELQNEDAYDGLFSHNSDHYFHCFINTLLRTKTPFNLVLFMPRTLGGLDNLLLTSDVGRALEVGGVYYFPPDGHRPAGEIPTEFLGSECYKVHYEGSLSKLRVTREKVPATTYVQHQGNFSYTLTLDPEADSLLVDRKAIYQGWPAEYYQIRLLLDMAYVLKAPDRFEKVWPYGFWTYHGFNEGEISGFRNDQREMRKSLSDSLIRQDVVSDFGEVGAVQTTLVRSGRDADSPELEFEQQFTTDQLMRKAGPNLLFDLGKLMGVQVAIKEEERLREVDVHMECPRMYRTTAHITIPEGYTVEGLEAFNVSVDNETGSFVSKAVFEAGQVIFTTEKIYKHVMEPAANWPLMLEFLDLAHDVSQKKILLKPKR